MAKMTESVKEAPEKKDELFRSEKITNSLVKIYEGLSDFLGEISAGIERANERNRQILKLLPETIYVPEGKNDPNYMIPDETFASEEDTPPWEETAQPEAQTESPKKEAPKAEPAKPSGEGTVKITLDDITKVIVTKIKQNRSVNDKIGALVKSYGYKQIRELPEDKYEAFLNDLAQL